jgi:hypothetical protein
MTKPDKQIIVDYIVSCLKLGEQRGKILVKTGKKWGTSKSAFDRLLKIAKEQHTTEQDAIKKELLAVDTAAAIVSRKKEIITVEERKELLTKIAIGKIKVPSLVVKWNVKLQKFETLNIMDLPGHASRISAIAELNRMEDVYEKDDKKGLTISINGKGVKIK